MNKQHLRNTLATLLLFCTGGAYAYGQTTVNGLTYTLDSEALTATLSGFETVADDSIVNIPERIVADAQTYVVTAIGNRAFYGSTFNVDYREKIQKVKAIIIPKTVKSIGQEAFSIPLYKGGTAYYDACSLESITFAEGSQLENIGKRAFGGRAIFELNLPEGLKTIGEEAFYQSGNLKRIGLPSTLDSIAPRAFYGTNALKSITLPEKLRVIGPSAFNTVSLVHPLGSTPPDISANTFGSNVTIEVAIDLIDVYKTHPVWGILNITGGNFEDEQQRAFEIIGSNQARLTNFNTSSIERIGSVTIPESEAVMSDGRTYQVTEYAAAAFNRIDTLHVEKSYTALPVWTFSQLKALFLPASVEDLTTTSFSSSNGVEIHLSAPQPPTILNTDGIGALFIDEGLIPAYAESKWAQVMLNPFWEDGIRYSRLFTAEKNVTVRDSKAEQLVISATVSHDGQAYTVACVNGIGANTRSVTIASAETELVAGAFQNTYYLESAELPEGMTTLPGRLFYNSGVKNVKLPSTLKVIGSIAFGQTRRLHHIDLPEGVTDIQYAAFNGSGIESLHLPASVRNIWETAFNGSFIKEFTVDEDNPRFCVEDGVLFSKDMKTIIAYPGGKLDKHYDMPNTVERIANASFYNSKLTSIRLSENYEGIAEYAVTNGSRDAFSYSEYNLAVHVSRLVDVNTFYKFGPINTLYLPAEYKEPVFEDYEDWESFEKDYYAWQEKYESVEGQIQALANEYDIRYENDKSLPFEFAFTVQDGEAMAVVASAESVRLPHNLTIPSEAIVQQRESNRSVWGSFPQSYFNEEDYCYHIPVVGINDNVFAACDSLVNVTLPAGIRFVGEAAFYGCKNLERVQGLGQMSLSPVYYNYENLSGVYNFAFAECPKLKQLDFGGNMLFNSTHIVGSTLLSQVNITDTLYVDDEHPRTFTEDGVVYHNSLNHYRDAEGYFRDSVATTLMYYPAAREATEFQVPDNLFEISNMAFAYSQIEKLTLPSMSGYIGSAAFYGNHSLKEVVLKGESLSQLPWFITEEANSSTSIYAGGRPYTYYGWRYRDANYGSRGYAWIEDYPSFDFDYTHENTVVYVKQSVIDEYESLAGDDNSYTARYDAYKRYFKEIRPLQDPSGIENVTTTERSATQGWYTLDGRRISQPSTSGIYIHNGRKIVIR